MNKIKDTYNLLVISFAPVILMLVGIYFELDFNNIMLLSILIMLQQIAFDTFWIRRK